MSYLDMAQSGASNRELGSMRPSVAAAQQSESEKINQQLIQRVFRMRTAVSRLKSDVGKLGGPQDTVDLRKSVASAISRIQEEAQDIKNQLLNVPPELKTRQTAKILSDFETTLKDFQTTMKVAKGKEAASLPKSAKPPPAKATDLVDLESREDPTEQMALLQLQRQKDDMVLSNQMTYNEALIDERDQGIAEIQQQIGEVNEIFQDLAVLVNDQGGQLNDIEANITRTADRTREAQGELVRAERSQRSARNKMCYILLIVGVVMGVLVITLSL